MKIPFPADLNGSEIMRRCGYGFITSRHSGQASYVRRLGSHHYPRFHVYVEPGQINLHLDQKQVSYAGTSAHSGEYDGPTVEAEGARIQTVISAIYHQTGPTSGNSDEPVSGSLWQRLFGNK